MGSNRNVDIELLKWQLTREAATDEAMIAKLKV
jgi:hypothetical protein